jgi:hypothetical protein
MYAQRDGWLNRIGVSALAGICVAGGLETRRSVSWRAKETQDEDGSGMTRSRIDCSGGGSPSDFARRP